MSRELFDLRWKKHREEQEHIQRLLLKGLHPVEIADRLIHIMLSIMREGFKSKYPQMSDRELMAKMREQIVFYDELKKQRRKV